MASFVQILIRDDDAIVSFSFPNAFEGCRGRPESVQASAVLEKLPSTLRRLCILLGPGLGHVDDLALSFILEYITNRYPHLASFSITSYASSWIPMTAVLSRVSRFGCRAIRIVDPAQKSEASITVHRRGSQVGHALSVVIPLCRLWEEAVVAALCDNFWQLDKLTILPPLLFTAYQEQRDTILASFQRFLSRARDLQCLSLPLELSSGLAPIILLASALPHCNKIELSCASLRFFFAQSSVISELISGLHHFDHLKKLALPAEVLCPSLHACLGGLRGLQELKIVAATTTTPTELPAPHPGQFATLRTLQILGTFSHLQWALEAFAHPEANSLRSIYVESKCLGNKDETRGAFEIMASRCPKVKELGVCIQNIHPFEKMDWLDLSPLCDLQLKDFVIHHPRPLALSDSDILRFLTAWSRAKHISLNPRPTLPAWVASGGAAPPLPTLTSLIHAAEHGRMLHHFGIYLNSRLPRTLGSRDRPGSLRELDLGLSRRSRQSAVWIQEVFPNAVVQ
ncbi:hypothetical protein LshimejAT787_0109070 [Lyophyllum shimeji]|uniref:Uncharacterized protein n=1 Tax=Lyophyllum shimeji TaxID=47721 RepID=A0A9P3PEK7_LYOSH|nr:hypothetical protein LshimejAT787_0109070 [Lyophyllum shimeji]